MSYTSQSIYGMNARAVAGFNGTKKIMKKLRQMKPQKLDHLIHSLHLSEFTKINCLECANCCKTISPSVFDSDVRRMAAACKMKTSDFIDRYLRPDQDNDYIFNTTPCPFLGEDNMCIIYEARPRACREYPHTDRKRMHQILEISAMNTKVCPAVFNIAERLKRMPTNE